MTDSFFFTAPGGREHNEDAVGQREIPGGTLFLLADGLGGHQRGAEASAQVIAFMQDAASPRKRIWNNGLLVRLRKQTTFCFGCRQIPGLLCAAP